MLLRHWKGTVTTMESDDVRIEGSVSLILSNRELLINKGADDGVSIGTRFVVLGRTWVDSEQFDIEFPKTIVKVVRFLGRNSAVGRTFRTIKGTSGLITFSGTPDHIETMEVTPGSTLRSQLSSEELAVQVGDRVRETRRDEYFDENV